MSVSGWSNGRVQFFLAGQNSNFEICEGATQRPGHEEPWCAYGMPMLCHSAIAVDARKLSVIQYDILWHDCDMIVTWLWSHVITMGIIIIRIYKNHNRSMCHLFWSFNQGHSRNWSPTWPGIPCAVLGLFVSTCLCCRKHSAKAQAIGDNTNDKESQNESTFTF